MVARLDFTACCTRHPLFGSHATLQHTDLFLPGFPVAMQKNAVRRSDSYRLLSYSKFNPSSIGGRYFKLLRVLYHAFRRIARVFWEKCSPSTRFDFSSFRRKPESRETGLKSLVWIPVCAGMTGFRETCRRTVAGVQTKGGIYFFIFGYNSPCCWSVPLFSFHYGSGCSR